jgi:hypothetical protein
MLESEKAAEVNIERLVAEDVRQAIWLRLRRMTSSRLCRQIISAKTKVLSPDVLGSKAEGLAWAVRSALGYWESNPADLNAKLLTRYYALLQISVAEQVASPNPTFDLKEAQRHTEKGHGLSTLDQPDVIFPNGYYVASLKSGHFYSYCKYLGFDLKTHAFEKRPREWGELDKAKQGQLLSLTDLFRRVPELQGVIEEYLGVRPLSLHVGYASRNQQIRPQQSPGSVVPNLAPPDSLGETTHIAIYPKGSSLTKEYLRSLNLPIQNIGVEYDSLTKYTYFTGSFTHPVGDYWWQHLKLYKSGYSGTSFIVPFWSGISDPFILHFIILYAMSIVVRYLPSLWHDIQDGELDHVRALLEHYLVIVDNVIPRLAVERITGIPLRVDSPGSLNAPV